jgi:hypothetical protein
VIGTFGRGKRDRVEEGKIKDGRVGAAGHRQPFPCRDCLQRMRNEDCQEVACDPCKKRLCSNELSKFKVKEELIKAGQTLDEFFISVSWHHC